MTPSLSSKGPPNVGDSGKRLARYQCGACTNACTSDLDFAKVIAAWPTLPEPIRQAVLSLIVHL